RLRMLKRMASPTTDPSAGDLVQKLDTEAHKAGFEPIGALNRGVSADEFFKGNTKFQDLETQLAGKNKPDNVPEVFDLIQQSDRYTPTRSVIQVLVEQFQNIIERRRQVLRNNRAPEATGEPPPAKGASQSSDGRENRFLL